MNESTHVDLIPKTVAIERLVNAAILMFFREDDELAIHCIAHSALSAAQEILTKRDKDVFSISLGTGIITMLQAIAKGEESNDEAFEWIRKNIYYGILEKDIVFLRNSDLSKLEIKADGLDQQKLWREYRRNYNFLKHAKTDEHASLNPSELKNADVIMFAVLACISLGITFSKEMLIFFRFCQSVSPAPLELDENERGIVEKLKEYKLGERKFACRYLVGDELPSIE